MKILENQRLQKHVTAVLKLLWKSSTRFASIATWQDYSEGDLSQ
jgi:hypothetical protein